MTILRISTTLELTMMTVSFKTERKRNISLQMKTRRNTGHSNHSPIIWSLPTTSTKECTDIEYAGSYPDLGDDEELILMHDDQTYLKTTWTIADQQLNGNWISQNVLNILHHAEHGGKTGLTDLF